MRFLWKFTTNLKTTSQNGHKGLQFCISFHFIYLFQIGVSIVQNYNNGKYPPSQPRPAYVSRLIPNIKILKYASPPYINIYIYQVLWQGWTSYASEEKQTWTYSVETVTASIKMHKLFMTRSIFAKFNKAYTLNKVFI